MAFVHWLSTSKSDLRCEESSDVPSLAQCFTVLTVLANIAKHLSSTFCLILVFSLHLAPESVLSITILSLLRAHEISIDLIGGLIGINPIGNGSHQIRFRWMLEKPLIFWMINYALMMWQRLCSPDSLLPTPYSPLPSPHRIVTAHTSHSISYIEHWTRSLQSLRSLRSLRSLQSLAITRLSSITGIIEPIANCYQFSDRILILKTHIP